MKRKNEVESVEELQLLTTRFFSIEIVSIHKHLPHTKILFAINRRLDWRFSIFAGPAAFRPSLL